MYSPYIVLLVGMWLLFWDAMRKQFFISVKKEKDGNGNTKSIEWTFHFSTPLAVCFILLGLCEIFK